MGRGKNPHRVGKHVAQVPHYIRGKDKIFCGVLCHFFAEGEETQG